MRRNAKGVPLSGNANSKCGEQRGENQKRCFLRGFLERTPPLVQQLEQAATSSKTLFDEQNETTTAPPTASRFPNTPAYFRGQILIFPPNFDGHQLAHLSGAGGTNDALLNIYELRWRENGRREERRAALTGRLKGAQTENCGVDECRLEWGDK